MNKRIFSAKRQQDKLAERQERQEENHYEKGCKGKEKYTQAMARIRARSISLQLGERLHPYECDFCGHWHIGHG